MSLSSALKKCKVLDIETRPMSTTTYVQLFVLRYFKVLTKMLLQLSTKLKSVICKIDDTTYLRRGRVREFSGAWNSGHKLLLK